MEAGEWSFIWLMFVMKLPIVALFVLVWWACRSPDVDEEDAGEGGSGVRPHPPRRPRRRRPRGPHGEPLPYDAPPRTRRARDRAPERQAHHR
jgi:hypothetical protein